MEQERYRIRVAVLLVLFREQAGRRQVLLQQRQNTGYADGYWDCAASGHLEARESLRAGLIREAAEELGIQIRAQDLKQVYCMHKFIPSLQDSYLIFYFTAAAYTGQPRINEPAKCAALQWFNLDALPEDLLDDRLFVIQHISGENRYLELDWEQV